MNNIPEYILLPLERNNVGYAISPMLKIIVNAWQKEYPSLSLREYQVETPPPVEGSFQPIDRRGGYGFWNDEERVHFTLTYGTFEEWLRRRLER